MEMGKLENLDEFELDKPTKEILLKDTKNDWENTALR